MPDIVERLRWLSSPDAERMGDFQRINNCVAVGHEACDEIERLRDGIQRVIDGTYGRDRYFETKHDTCPHGKFSWEACDRCVDDYLASLLSPSHTVPSGCAGTQGDGTASMSPSDSEGAA